MKTWAAQVEFASYTYIQRAMDEHDPGESLANPPTASIELRDLGEAQSSIGIGQSLHVEDDDAKRAQQLEELRRQLSVGSSEHRHNDSHTGRGRSASHRGYEEPVERHLQDVQNANNPANPAEIKQLHTERKRKVQWVGVEDEGEMDWQRIANKNPTEVIAPYRSSFSSLQQQSSARRY